jgi:hypothetical protein
VRGVCLRRKEIQQQGHEQARDALLECRRCLARLGMDRNRDRRVAQMVRAVHCRWRHSQRCSTLCSTERAHPPE